MNVISLKMFKRKEEMRRRERERQRKERREGEKRERKSRDGNGTVCCVLSTSHTPSVGIDFAIGKELIFLTF